jgi:hypothetical protein
MGKDIEIKNVNLGVFIGYWIVFIPMVSINIINSIPKDSISLKLIICIIGGVAILTVLATYVAAKFFLDKKFKEEGKDVKKTLVEGFKKENKEKFKDIKKALVAGFGVTTFFLASAGIRLAIGESVSLKLVYPIMISAIAAPLCCYLLLKLGRFFLREYLVNP